MVGRSWWRDLGGVILVGEFVDGVILVARSWWASFWAKVWGDLGGVISGEYSGWRDLGGVILASGVLLDGFRCRLVAYFRPYAYHAIRPLSKL